MRVGTLNVVELSTLILAKLKVRAEVDVRFCGRVAVLVRPNSIQPDQHAHRSDPA